jgi:Uma2 family endonuclease
MAANSDRGQRRLISVVDYDRMIQAGIFPEDDRLELIEGEIVAMSPMVAAHAGLVAWLTRLFTERFRDVALVYAQNPIHLPRSEPQPDVALLRPRPDYYTDRLPEARDVLLLIEIADTTLAYDRAIKLPLYARSGIQECWLIDLAQQTIDICRGPAANYGEIRTARVGDTLTVLAIPAISISVGEILRLPR